MTDKKVTCVACKGAGGGATYTAGTGIVIENNEISADTSVLATKAELPNTLFTREYTHVDFDTFINDFCYADNNKYYLKQPVLLSFNWGGEISGTYNILSKVSMVIAKDTLIKDGNTMVLLPKIIGCTASGKAYVSGSTSYKSLLSPTSTNPSAYAVTNSSELLQSGWTSDKKALHIYY